MNVPYTKKRWKVIAYSECPDGTPQSRKTVYHLVGGPDILTEQPGETAANAALMQTAPKMLEVLNEALREVKGFQQRTGVKQFSPWIGRVEAVIAEATGVKP